MPSGSNDNTIPPNGSSRLSPEHLLRVVMAKSPEHSPDGRPVPLTAHSGDTRDAVLAVAARIGLAGVLAEYPRFWTWAEQAGLLHDARKIAAGFQRQGAVTLADRAASAGVELDTVTPLRSGYLAGLAAPCPHQRERLAAAVLAVIVPGGIATYLCGRCCSAMLAVIVPGGIATSR